MSLRFILGRSGYGKTQFCLNEIKNALLSTDERNLIYLVPEQSTLQSEKDLIKFTQNHGSIQAQVLSFNRLAYHVFLETGRSNRKILENTGNNMLLRKIVMELKSDLLFFQAVLNKKGFMEILSSTVTEFFKYGIVPDDLIKVSERFAQKQILYSKISDLHKIYTLYLQRIHENYLSNDEVLDLLVEQIENSQKLSNSCFWIDGFNSFIPQEYKVIEKLLNKASQVNITMCADTFNQNGLYDPFLETKTSMKKIIQLAHNIEKDETVLLNSNNRLDGFPELDFFEKHYLSNDAIEYQGETNNIKIRAFSNAHEEVAETAKAIRLLLMTKKYRYRDIAIVASSLPDYEKLIKCIMNQFDIKVFIDTKIDILSHPLTELIRSALDVVVSNWSYESVFRFLKTGLTNVNIEDIDILENYVLAYGIKGRKWLIEWEYGFKGKYERFDKESINQCRLSVIKNLLPFVDKLYAKKKMSIRDISKRIFDMLYSMNVLERLEEQITIEKDAVAAQIWSKIVDVFNKLVEILGDENVTILEYAQIVTAGLEEIDMGLIPPTQDQIIVGDIERSRFPEIKAMFVLGVNDGILPSVNEDNGIFTDEERILMASENIELAPNNKQKAFYETFLIYSVLTKPTEYLQLSYNRQPSSLITKLKKMFPKLDKSDLYTNEYVAVPSHELGVLSNTLRKQENIQHMPDTYKYIYKWFYENEYYNNSLIKMERFLNRDIKVERLNQSTVKRLYKDKLNTSVSKLEKYVDCPFAYFVEHMLYANERKQYKVENFDLGTVFHEIVDMFFKEINNNNLDIKQLSDNEIDQISDKNINLLYNQKLKKNNDVLFGTARHEYFMTRVKHISKRTIWALTEHLKLGNFKPEFNEVEFSENIQNMAFDPIVLELEDGTNMVLSGRIDRADILHLQDGDYVKIIDYKSGEAKINLEEIYYGKQLQLILYLDALIQSLVLVIELSPAAVLYFKIGDPIIEYVKDDLSDLKSDYLKQFKMSGLVLNKKEVILGIDNDIKTHSSIIPATFVNSKEDKNEKVVKSTEYVLEPEQFDILRSYVKNKIKSLGEEIISGNIAVKPYKYGDITGCKYCKYSSICQIDACTQNTKYNHFQKFLSKDDIFTKMKQD